MLEYNLEYHKKLNQSHILPNILNGAKMGVISQFVADIVLSLLLYNEKIIIEDIKISGIASYYAAVFSGMMGSFLSIYMDPFATTLFTVVTYAYTFALVNSLKNKEPIELHPVEMVFDTGVSILLIYAFDPTSKNQYYRYSEKRHFIEPIHKRMDRSLGQNLFITVLVNTYGFLKLQNRLNNENQN